MHASSYIIQYVFYDYNISITYVLCNMQKYYWCEKDDL